MRRRGSALIVVLWCLVLLAVVVTGSLRDAKVEMRIAHNHLDAIQARCLALAGIEKAKALIHAEARALRQGAQGFRSGFLDDSSLFREETLGRGRYRIIREPEREEGGRGPAPGVVDEASRLNVNGATPQELQRLPGMTSEVAAAIVDFRDEDRQVTPGGAEAEDYLALSPPLAPFDRPFRSLREILLVRGVSPALLLGEDRNGNGLLDPEEDDGELTEPPDNRDGILDAGWSGYLSVESQEENQDAQGRRRIDLRSATETRLQEVDGITAEIAKAIVAWRGKKKIESLVDLLEVTAPQPERNGQPGGANPAGAPGGDRSANPGPGNGAPDQAVLLDASGNATPSGEAPANDGKGDSGGGPKVIDQKLLLKIADRLTVDAGYTRDGVVNLNTAPARVLALLDGLDADLAEAIVSHRGRGPFPSAVHLLEVPGITPEILKKVLPRVGTRAETFRIAAEGKIAATGARRRIETSVHLSSTGFETLSYREEP